MKMKKHEQGKKYSILSNVGWMVNLSWHTSKAAFLLCLAASSLEVLLQLTNLYIAPQILRQVEQHVPLSHLLLTIGGFTAALFLLMGLKEYVKVNVMFPRVNVRVHIIGKLGEKNNTTSYSNTLKQDFIKLREKANHSLHSNDSSAEHIWVTLTLLLQNTGVLWSSIFVTLMANKIGGLQFGIYRNCQISSRVFHTAVAALPLTKANRSDFE